MPRRGYQSRSRRRSYGGRGGSRSGYQSRRSGGYRKGGRQRLHNRFLAGVLFLVILAVGYGIYLDSIHGQSWFSFLMTQHHLPELPQQLPSPQSSPSLFSHFKHQTQRDDPPRAVQHHMRPAPKPPPEPEKPHFDFYNLLSKNQDKPAPAAHSEQPQMVGQSTYHLQVGEYRDKSKAEALQDKLALAGFPASIVQLRSLLGDRYRVMVGPYRNLLSAHDAKNELQRFGIEGVLR